MTTNVSNVLAKRPHSLNRIIEFCSTLEWQAWVVLSYALCVMIYIQIVYPFFHAGADQDLNFFMARFILHLPGGLYISIHGPGMALFLIFSGVIPLDTWSIMIFLYALMSVAIPCFAYGIIRSCSRYWALIAAIVITTGLIPYAYSRIDSYDHLFLFFEFFTFFLVALYFKNPRQHSRLSYLIAIVFFALNLIKPIAVFLYWVFFTGALIIPASPRRILLKSMFLYLILMTTWIIVDRNFGNGGFPEWNQPANSLQRRFAETYYLPHHFLFVKQLRGAPVITKNDGPASKALYEAVSEQAWETKKLWGNPNNNASSGNLYPYALFGQYANDPNQLTMAIFQGVNAIYFDFIRQAVSKKLGVNGDSLLYRVASEHHHTGFIGLINYLLHNPFKVLTGPGVGMGLRNLLDVYIFSSLREAYAWNIFVDGKKIPKSIMINSENGPYSQEFLSGIQFFLKDFPAFWQPHWAFKKFAGRPDELYQVILNNALSNYLPWDPIQFGTPEEALKPLIVSSITEGWFYTLFLNIYGSHLYGPLFSNAVRETVKRYPMSLLLFVDNFLHQTLSFPRFDITHIPNMDELIRSSFVTYSETGIVNYQHRENSFEHIGPGLSRELIPHITADRHSHFIAFMYELMHVIAPFFVVLAILVFPFAVLGSARYAALFLAAAYLYFVAIFSVFGGFGSQRYSDIFILLPILLAALGLGSIHTLWKATAKLSSKKE